MRTTPQRGSYGDRTVINTGSLTDCFYKKQVYIRPPTLDTNFGVMIKLIFWCWLSPFCTSNISDWITVTLHHYISFDIHCNHYTINQQCLNVLTLSIISIFISILLVTLRLTYCSHLSLHQQSHRISYIHFLFSHSAFSSKKKKKEM